MQRKLFRTGNSLTVTIPPDLAAKLGFQAGSLVELEVDREHDGLIIRHRVEEDSADAPFTPEFATWVDGFVDRYEGALRQLAGDVGEPADAD
jgi:virulence-associated protein VagC